VAIAKAFEEKVEIFIAPGWFILAFAVKALNHTLTKASFANRYNISSQYFYYPTFLSGPLSIGPTTIPPSYMHSTRSHIPSVISEP
jgi:hypothetical protein